MKETIISIQNAGIYARHGCSQKKGRVINKMGNRAVAKFPKGRKIIVKTVEITINPNHKAKNSKKASRITVMIILIQNKKNNLLWLN